jgi:hypothetical protein
VSYILSKKDKKRLKREAKIKEQYNRPFSKELISLENVICTLNQPYHCLKCAVNLKSRQAKVRLVKTKSAGSGGITYIEAQVQYCSECKMGFMSESSYRLESGKYYPHSIGVILEKEYKAKPKSKMSSSSLNSRSNSEVRSYQITPATKEKNTKETAYKNDVIYGFTDHRPSSTQFVPVKKKILSSESELHRAGYQILPNNRMRRRDVLTDFVKNKRMSVDEIKRTIKGFINQREGMHKRGTRDYSFCLAEWEADLFFLDKGFHI